MVTFSIPGDDNVAAGGNIGTPRSRPPLPFAKRPLSASSSFGGSAKRLGTPQGTPGRNLLGRDALPSGGSSLGRSSISSTRNIFRASAMSDSPSVTTFSPKLPQDTMTKLFAPGGTPNPSRTFRETTAQPSPRGMAAKASDKDLFNMRIASPPPDLTGEALSAKVPKDWNSKSSIYADQFLAHLCPADFDDEQRRQFFCILDLRRLKYAADEIFSKKTWKLNIMNFAKEFEKSRSIILLRYGLYEFQNVKPSKEILKRWRREHGLPEPEGEDESQPTPTKASSVKKRKAVDDSADHGTPSINGKRRAMDKETADISASQQPSFLNKNKRKASPSKEVDTQPAKMSKPTSASAALFGQIAEKHKASPAPATATPKQSIESPAPKANLFGNKGANGGALSRSVFSNLKPPTAQGSASPNIFGYLSDASSAKNSGVEADAESEADSEQDESQEAGQSDEPSGAASGAETASQVGFGLLNKPSVPATASSSAPGTRESTPGRSLFDRVTKTSDGQLARAESTEPAAIDRPAPVDQTWNPSSTPIKFAPTTAAKPSFGAPTSAPTSSLFASKSAASSNIFGAPKTDQGSEKAASKETTPAATEKDGNESDKENDGQAPNKSIPETKAPPQPSFGSSLFSAKPAGAEPAKDVEPSKPAMNLFGSSAQPTAATNMFGSSAKPAASTPATPAPVMQSSTLFGANATGSQTPAGPAPSTASSLFGASQAPAKADDSSSKPSSLFGGSQATSNSNNLFGRASPAPSQPLFGAPKPSTAGSEPEKKSSEAPAQPAAAPIFSFGAPASSTSQAAPKPLFGAPKSPAAGPAGGSLFSGSPMKQDEPSPAKKPFPGSSAAGAAPPTFSFGNTQSQPSGNMFGSATNNAGSVAANSSVNFGGASSNASSGGFNFNFSGAPSAAPVNNPFSNAGDQPASAAPASGGMFSGFGGASTPAGGATPSFQFGAASGTGAANTSGAPLFGSNQTNSSAPSFGGSGTPAATGTPMFNFTSASPQPGQGSAPTFGSNTPAPAFGSLQPPAGGASTTGTNSPFSLGGGSSLATTPAGGTPEPTSQAEGSKESAGDEEGEKQEQVNLTEGLEKDEDILHEVRAKALKFVPASEKEEGDGKAKSSSPWSTRGVGPLRLLKHKESGLVRLLLRAEPRGHVAINRAVLPDMTYKADEKYVRLTTSNESGDGLETWMLQVKTKDSAKELAEALEKNKVFNKK